jgi:CRISPR-associated Cas5-like protein
VEQSRPELLCLVDIILGAGGSAVFSGRWRAFALGHRLCVGDHLVFRFKLGMLEASVRNFTAAGVRRTYHLPTVE